MPGLEVNAQVALLGLLAGAAMGWVTRTTWWCTMGAVADAYYNRDFRRLRSWLLAAAVAVAGTQSLHFLGLIDIHRSFLLAPSFGWLGAIVGGLMFGYGMALVGTCGYGALIRLGGGDLRALLVYLSLAVSGYMTMRGLFGVFREGVVETTNLEMSGPGSQGGPELVAWAIGSEPETTRAIVALASVLLLLAITLGNASFRRSWPEVWGGLAIGALIVCGWAITGIVGADEFDPVQLRSMTFVRPVGDSLVYLMTYSGAAIDFGVGTVGGVLVGSFLTALAKGQFEVEGYDDEREMLRHILGGGLMGVGGVMAVGCTIGQGMSGMSALALSSPVALASIFIGAVLGLRNLTDDRILGGLGSLVWLKSREND